MKKKKASGTKKSEKELVSKKRAKEIADTFQALNIVSNQPYTGAEDFSNSFQRVSIYQSAGYIYKTSGSSNG